MILFKLYAIITIIFSLNFKVVCFCLYLLSDVIMKWLFALLTLFTFNSFSQEVHNDSISVTVFVQFLVTKEGEIKRLSIPEVEGEDCCSKQFIKELKKKAENEVLAIKEFDVSNEKQWYRMPFLFKFTSEYEIEQMNLILKGSK